MSFYEEGGLQYLRHRFDGRSSNTSDSDSDFFASPSLSTLSPLLSSKDTSTTSPGNLANKSCQGSNERSQSGSSRSSRHMVQAGDLLVPKGVSNDASRPVTRTFSVLTTPRVPYNFDGFENGKSSKQRRGTSHWPTDDFDLRGEVMSCIAKSIGLLQPPLSGSDSPPSPPSELRRTSSAFGSLSLLDLGDDMSSVTGGSSIPSGNYLSGLDNEVEILFYAAGTTLAKAGESNTGTVFLLILWRTGLLTYLGLFYVIEGFLDILLPLTKSSQDQQPIPKSTPVPDTHSEFWRNAQGPKDPKDKRLEQKLLFTVKPGGIAGYLGQLRNSFEGGIN